MLYHLNPFSGEPNVCRAAVRSCPWADEANHYATEREARLAYETLMAEDTFSYSSWDSEMSEEDKAREAEEERAFEAAKARRVYLSEDQVAKISTVGIQCPHCDAQALPREAAKILNVSEATACHGCGAQYDLDTVKLRVGEDKDTYGAFRAENVASMTWYHSTDGEDWHTYLYEEGFVAHLGSMQAALDRRLAEDYATAVRRDGFWLYALSVDSSARIEPEVADDGNEDYEFESEALRRSDVVRYVNRWEDMASISLAARSSSLTVTGRRWVSAEEAMASPSLYNVRPEE